MNAKRPAYPVAIADLIGRDATVAAVREALGAHQVVTLCGPAGVGKTVIAEFIASEDKDAAICDVSDALDLGGVYSALAANLGARLTDVRTPEDAQVRIHASLQSQAVSLLVLDNCEHLRAEIDEVIRLVTDESSRRVLVTSREPLFVPEEFRVQIEQLDVDSALSMLETRGAQACPGFAFDADSRECALRVIEKLDRLPFAIELFAARLDILSLAELEQRLQTPHTVLRAPRGTRARHADVAAAIQVSWDLLSDDEKSVLLQLSAFVGGATFGALHVALGERGYAGELLDDLSSLNRKYLSYTSRIVGLEVRYHLLETVRGFLLQEAEAQELQESLVVAHAAALLRDDAPHAQATAAGDLALAREVENLSAIVRRCGAFAPQAVAAAALQLSHHRALHGPLHAHLDVLDIGIANVSRGSETDPPDAHQARQRARLLRARGDVLRKMGRLRAAEEDLDRALEVSERANDLGLVAAIESSRAMAALLSGNADDAGALIQRAIDLATEANDERALGNALQRGGAVQLVRGNYPLVEEMCMRALSALEVREDHRGKTNALTYLGIGRLDNNRTDAARTAFEEARALYARSDDVWSISVCDVYVALIDLDEAVATPIDHERLAAARGRLDTARNDAEFVGHARLAAFADGMRGAAAHHAGDLDAAEALCRRAVAKAMLLKDFLAVVVGGGHLAGVLAEKGALDEARHWLQTAEQMAPLLPNPGAQASLVAIEGLIALHGGDLTLANERLAAASTDVTVHLRVARGLLERALGPTPDDVVLRPRLVVRSDGRRVTLPTGEEIDLSRRGPLRRILVALADAHCRGVFAIDVHGTVDVGWPGEKLSTESGTARVYTAIRTLRKLGLEGWLITRDDGYLLRDDLDVQLVDESSSTD